MVSTKITFRKRKTLEFTQVHYLSRRQKMREASESVLIPRFRSQQTGRGAILPFPAVSGQGLTVKLAVWAMFTEGIIPAWNCLQL